MPTIDSARLQSFLHGLIEKADIPAISYAYIAPSEDGAHAFHIEEVSLGVKSAADQTNPVDSDTIFPASSLSKIVFAYLVLKLVEEGKLGLDQPLHEILPDERFKIDGTYPADAKKLTARHVLSHTTGLPNLANPDAPLRFNFKPGEKLGDGYYYSGEAFLYLQKTIAALMGKGLEALAKQYVFDPLEMTRSSYKPAKPDERDIVKVHTRLGTPEEFCQGRPEQNSAASLITTASDYAKFMVAWLSQTSDIFAKQAFFRREASETLLAGLGWHIHDGIAWQHGANDNTKSFVAIDIEKRTGIVFFTNSENGMHIANQILTGGDGLPHIGDMSKVLSALGYSQSDKPGWEETFKGRIAEDEGKLDDARRCYEAAKETAEKAGKQDSEQHRRLAWFNAANQLSRTRSEFTTSLEAFTGRYAHGAKVFIEDGKLILKTDTTDKLVRISENEFVPERDQKFKIKFEDGKMSVLFLPADKSYDMGRATKLELVDRPVTHLRDAKTAQPAMDRTNTSGQQPSYARSTESSKAKQREKFESDSPKPPWKP